MRATSVFKIVGLCILGLIAIAAIGFGLGLIVMLLWNWLMPTIFGLPELSYWQAVGLTVLSHLLFKSHLHHRPHDRPPKKARDFKEKVRSMIHGDCRSEETESA
jgi:hypothetical protein